MTILYPIKQRLKIALGMEKCPLANPYYFEGEQGVRPVHHRGVHSDVDTITQVFLQKDYDLSRLKRGAELRDIASSMTKPLIIDAGANIGPSTIWFSSDFPNAHVVSFEPDHDNFSFLRRNTTSLNVDLRESAIGATDGTVSLLDPGLGQNAFRTQDDQLGPTKREAMSRVVREKMAQGFSPFLAKVDIEGGEADLFSSDTDWVDQFPLLIIELHDWLLPGQRTAQPFLQCIASKNRDFVYLNENVFSVRN